MVYPFRCRSANFFVSFATFTRFFLLPPALPFSFSSHVTDERALVLFQPRGRGPSRGPSRRRLIRDEHIRPQVHTTDTDTDTHTHTHARAREHATNTHTHAHTHTHQRERVRTRASRESAGAGQLNTSRVIALTIIIAASHKAIEASECSKTSITPIIRAVGIQVHLIVINTHYN